MPSVSLIKNSWMQLQTRPRIRNRVIVQPLG